MEVSTTLLLGVGILSLLPVLLGIIVSLFTFKHHMRQATTDDMQLAYSNNTDHPPGYICFNGRYIAERA